MYLTVWATEVADIAGLKHVFGKGSKLRRLIWAVFVIASTITFGYQTWELTVYFFQYHHVTKVDVTYSEHVDFPALTICNFNKYRETAWTEEDIKHVGYSLGKLASCMFFVSFRGSKVILG